MSSPKPFTISPELADLLADVVRRGGSPEVTGDLEEDLRLLERLGDWARVHVPTRSSPVAIITPHLMWSERVAKDHGLGPYGPYRRRWLHIADDRSGRGLRPSFYYVESDDEHPLRPAQLRTLHFMRAMGWRSILDGS